jgi:hypothetical protein
MFRRKTILAIVLWLAATPSWSKVFVRWTEPLVPPAASLGVDELVAPVHAKGLIANARRAGYKVYVEVPISQLPSSTRVASMRNLEGIFLDPAEAKQAQISHALAELRTAFPRLTVRVLDSRGQQPEMKGQLVTTRNGVLQVSSATAQPWISSNLALILFDQVLDRARVPLYSFRWNSPESLQPDHGPEAADYLLAVAEAGAFHADLVLSLHKELQKGLWQKNPAARETFAEIKHAMAFSAQATDCVGEPEANVGIVIGDYRSSYEPVNLLARHNIPFRLLRTLDLKTATIETLDVLVFLRTVNKEATGVIENFASKGGVVILVDSHGPYPWHFDNPTEQGGQSVSHKVGKGQIIQLGDPSGDPDSFAQDIRRLIDNNRIAISLWNALTTVAVSYRKTGSSEKVVELINYAQEPLTIQVQIKGLFSSIRYESPQDGCCKALTGVQQDGHTEFVIPGLAIAGRVRLAENSAVVSQPIKDN